MNARKNALLQDITCACEVNTLWCLYIIMYLKTLGRNLIRYKYSSSDNVWGSGIVCCNHISLPMLLIKAFVIMSGEKISSYCLIAVLFALSWSPVVKSTKGLIFQFVKYTVFVFLVLSLFYGRPFINKCPSSLVKKIKP